MPTKAVPGDVIQIDPEYSAVFGGCFAIVEKVKGWGVSLCYVRVPGKGDAYYRLPHTAYVVVGRAEWLHADEDEDEPSNSDKRETQ